MDNLVFLKTINAAIYKSIDNKFYVDIPFAYNYNEENNYIGNYLNNISILITEKLLNNDDLNDFLNNLDDRYEYLSGEETDSLIYSNSSKNYIYYANLNKIIDIAIDEDDIKNTNVTFMNILKETYTYNNLEVDDYLYKYVIDFYSNGQYDDAIILMNSIFNNNINVSTTANCGCNQQVSNCTSNLTSSNTINTGTELVNYDTASCLDKYKSAMFQWLQNMLSNTEFYCHWLFIYSEDDNKNIPNETIIDKLIELLQFLLDNYDLSNLGKTTTSYCNHGSSIKCNESFNDIYGSSINNDCSNYSIIKNYIETLNYIKENKVIENKNKIYIYGKKFAEIFPLLNF